MPFDGQLLPLRRLTVADVLDGAFRTFRAVFAPAAVIVLVIIGPLQFATNLVLSRVAPGIVGGGLSAIIDLDVFAAAPADNALVLTNLVSGLLGYLLSLVASAGVVALLLAVDRGEERQVTSPLGLAFRVLLPTLIASFLLGVLGIGAAIALAIGSVVLLVIPILGVVVMVLVVLPLYLLGIASFVALISLVVPVAVVERQGPLATLARAVRVFTRQPLRIAWISLLVGVVTVILALALQLPFLLLSEVAPTGGWAIEALGETTGQILSVPVSAAAALLVYLDVRVRWEAVDLRHRARTLVPR
ncbi:MAG: hypothetical protein EA340_15510 [Nitriliruptor sp.]|nr:MAG: hypothetical protein EA340_15510 [Nitriliruptor sp.]